MHALFSWQTPQTISPDISDEALKAAESFVNMCVQHAAFLAGRGELTEAIENVQMLQQGNKGLSVNTIYLNNDKLFSSTRE